MANIKSAKKRIKQNEKRNIINKSRLNKMKTFIKKLEEAIFSKNKEESKKLFPEVESIIAKTAQKGTIKKNTLRRKVSKLALKVKSLN